MTPQRRGGLARLTGIALTVTATMFVLPGAAHADPPTWQPRPATYDVVIEKDVPIPMSDGTVLLADIRRPAEHGKAVGGRFPVIVSQTAYNKNLALSNFHNEYLVRRGYVQVIVDIRGTGSSAGQWQMTGPVESHDGKEIVEWAASPERQWSTGKIGLFGASYGGITQFMTAAEHPEGLAALFPVVPPGDTYRDWVAPGGNFDGTILPWALAISELSVLPPAFTAIDPQRAADTVREHLDALAQRTLPFLGDGLTGGDKVFDGPFWRERSPSEYLDKVNVPTFIVGGQQDVFQRAAPMYYEKLVANGVPARFVQGPWDHLRAMDATMPMAGDNAVLDPAQPPGSTMQELSLRWFDHYVRGDADPGLDTDVPPVQVYEQGTGRWESLPQWPIADVTYRKLSLTGQAAPGRSGALTLDGESAGSPDVAPWNPLAGLCSRSVAIWTLGMLSGNPCSADHRVNDMTGLTYDLAVDRPLRFAGAINAHLSIESPAADGVVVVRLEDVAPDGTVRQIAAGSQSLAARSLDESRSVVADGLIVQPWHPYTPESIEPMPPGQPVAVDVEIWPTVAAIEPGHRLRVAVQTADTPRVLPSAPQAAASGREILIHHSPQAPSWIALPVRE